MNMRATAREAGGVLVVDLSGRILLGDDSAYLRKMIRSLLDEGHRRIVLNLGDVDYIDSSGIGELVSGYSAVRSQGGELKLLNLSRRVRDLLQLTKLYTVFEIYDDEAAGIASFK